MNPDPGHDGPEPRAAETTDRLGAVWRALETVVDPEIPVVNVVEMGMIAGVRLNEGRVAVDMTPTFAGCPALDVIRGEIKSAIERLGERDPAVRIVYDPPWTTERISEAGRAKLKAFGLAPPGKNCTVGQTPDLERVPCPRCDSSETDMESIFGPTLCRSIHYCRNCLQSFEHFKAV